MGITLYKYLFKEVTQFFVLVIFILVLISLVGKLLVLMDILINRQVGVIILIKLLVFTIPFFLIYIVPIAYLLSLLIVFNRLSGDREVIALKASGISIIDISKPIFLYTILPFLLTLFLTIYAFPWGNRGFKDNLYSFVSQGGIKIKEKTFNDDFKGLVIYANKTSPNGKRLNKIFIYDEREEMEPRVIIAREGILSIPNDSFKVRLLLKHGTIYSQRNNNILREVTFVNYQVVLEPMSLEKKALQTKTNRELYLSELYRRIKKKIKEGQDPAPYIIDLHKRFSLPFAVFAFTLLAIPLGTHYKRGGSLRGFIIGLIIILHYYLLSTFLEFLGNSGRLNPELATWAPNLIFALLGAFLLYQSNHETYNRPLGVIEEKIYSSVAYIKGLFGIRGYPE